MHNTPSNANIVCRLYHRESIKSVSFGVGIWKNPSILQLYSFDSLFVCFRFPIGLSSISLVLSANTTLSQILSRLCLKLIPSSLCQCTSCSHSPPSYLKPFYSSHPLNNLHDFSHFFPPNSLLLALLRCRLRALPLSQSQLFLKVQQFGHLCCNHSLLCLLGFERSHLFSL